MKRRPSHEGSSELIYSNTEYGLNDAKHITPQVYTTSLSSFKQCDWEWCLCVCVCVCSGLSDSLWPCGLQSTRLLCPWGFSRQEYWSGLTFPSPGDLPDPGIEPTSLVPLAMAGGFFTTNATWEAWGWNVCVHFSAQAFEITSILSDMTEAT